MPKRTNPFGENSPLQYKTHVGKKELDMGVNKEKNMQLVYDKTKSLLFEGSTKTLDCSACGTDPQWSGVNSAEQLLLPLPGQMRLDTTGRLCDKIETVSTNRSDIEPTEMETECQTNENYHSDRCTKSPGKQLQIGKDGKLNTAVLVRSYPASNTGFCICHSCNRPTNLSMRKCDFCDKLTCNGCINQCFLCKGLFCHLCSILNYDDLIEHPYCLQCSEKTT